MPTLYLTGSSGGLGRVVRQYYLERGWTVAGFDVQNDGFTQARYQFFRVDSSNETSVAQAYRLAANESGPPRALVATIGGIKPWANVDETSIDDFFFIVNLNFVSCFITVKHALKLMKQYGEGSLITIGADTGLRPEPRKATYASTKAAVIAFTQAVALETKEYGVNANCIVPTVIHTKANEEWGINDEIRKWTAPEDIAALCYYLSSDSGRSINGAVIRIPNKM